MIARITSLCILDLGFTFGYLRIPQRKPTGFYLDGWRMAYGKFETILESDRRKEIPVEKKPTLSATSTREGF